MDKDGNFIGYKKYDKSIVYFESYKEFTKIKHDELEDYGRLIFDINPPVSYPYTSVLSIEQIP